MHALSHAQCAANRKSCLNSNLQEKLAKYVSSMLSNSHANLQFENESGS